MIIKIDCDGVLRNLLADMCKIYNRRFSTHIRPDECTCYDVEKIFPLCQIELGVSAAEYLFDLNGEELFANGTAFDNIESAIKMLKGAGHTIIIVTAQNSVDNKIDTLKWLDNNNIYYDDIAFTNNKENVFGDIMIDDNVNVLKKCPSYTKPICISAPYNLNCDYDSYDSLFDFVKNFLKYEKQHNL
jgi:5'(3')-deoxyribonucleotidase